MPSPSEAEYPAGLPMRGMDSSTLSHDLDDDPFAGSVEHQPERVVRRKSSGAALLIMFLAGVAATVAWYSFGGPVREALAGMSPQLAWMAPQSGMVPPPDQPPATTPAIDQVLSAQSQDIDAVRQNVDRIANAQDQIIRSINQLTAGQELLTKEIGKLQQVEQYILYKNSEPPPAPRVTAVPPPIRRPTGGPLPVTPPPATQPPPAH